MNYKTKTQFTKPEHSKTHYLYFQQRPKLLWLNLHKAEFKEAPNEMEEAIFEKGTLLGEMACKQYPNKAIYIGRSGDLDQDLLLTENLLSEAYDPQGKECSMDYKLELPKGYSWKYETFYEPCFVSPEGLYCFNDILLRNKYSEFKLVEVKSTGEIKPYHIHDITFQNYVLRQNGLKVLDNCITHIDKNYIRGKRLSNQGLFIEVNVNDRIDNYMTKSIYQKSKAMNSYLNKLGEAFGLKVQSLISEAFKKKDYDIEKILKNNDISYDAQLLRQLRNNYFNDQKKTTDEYLREVAEEMKAIRRLSNEPVDTLGSWIKYPHSSGFEEYLTKDLAKDHILFLGMDKSLGIKSKEKEVLQSQGINRISQITPEIMKQYNFSEAQKREIAEWKRHINGKKSKVWNNPEGFVEHFSTLKFPLCFFDFETVQPAIPLFEGGRPNQRMACQFSIHIVNERGQITEHKEFLFAPSKGNKNPELECLEAMKRCIPQDGTIVVYWADFERGVIKELGERYPQYENYCNSLIERLWDLCVPFYRRDHFNVEQKGSASIKKVLPLFTNERSGFSYKELNIQNGLQATMAYLKYLEGGVKYKKQEELKFRSDLLDYCKLDTLAMVMILVAVNERLNINLFDPEKRPLNQKIGKVLAMAKVSNKLSIIVDGIEYNLTQKGLYNKLKKIIKVDSELEISYENEQVLKE